jgi:ankyrin repeat protein
VTILLRMGAKPMAKDLVGRDALHQLVSQEGICTCINGELHWEKPKMQTWANARTKQLEAIDFDNGLECLLGAGCEVASQDINGRTCLHYAARLGGNTLEKLLYRGAVCSKPENIYSPLDEAVLTARMRNVLLLLKFGEEFTNLPSLLCALVNAAGPAVRPREIAAKLSTEGAPVPLRGEATPVDYTLMVEFLLKNGATANSTDSRGRTPLLIACEHGNKPMVNLLLAAGADGYGVNQRGQNAPFAAPGADRAFGPSVTFPARQTPLQVTLVHMLGP